MATRPQHSKRDRGRAHVGLPPKQEPKYGYCPSCGEGIHNRGAHAEACPGPPSNQPLRCMARGLAGDAFSVYRQCGRPWGHSGEHIF